MSSIDGEWTGVYDYPGLELDPTPFKVKISSGDTGFRGEVSEPHLKGGTTIFSDITGQISGCDVCFTKNYDQVDDEYPVVFYEGKISENFSKIEGIWTTQDDMPWSGPFVMNRARSQKLNEQIKESLYLNQ